MKYLLWFVLSSWAFSGQGHLVLMGGGKKPAAGMERFIALAGGTNATIMVLPTASGDPETPAYYRALFAEYGCEKVTVVPLKTRADALAGMGRDVLEKADGLFFTGGDQRRITAALLETPFLERMVQRFSEGMVVGGTSAGTACMSATMLTGDGLFDRITQNNVVHTPGLGLARGMILDQHFVARSRQNRLLSMVLTYPDMMGVGVDEDTAVWIKPNQTFEVLGGGQVVVYSARGAKIRAVAGTERFATAGVSLHVLVHGDRFDINHGTPLVGREKEPTR